MAKKKKDENVELDIECQLNEAQKLFCELYVRGEKIREAYMTAYPNSNANSASANGNRLLKQEKIIKYINKLLDNMQESCEINDREIVRELKRIAFHSKNDNARIKALTTLGQISGLLNKEQRVTNNTIMITVQEDDKLNLPGIEESNDVVGSSEFIVVDEDNNEEE